MASATSEPLGHCLGGAATQLGFYVRPQTVLSDPRNQEHELQQLTHFH